MKRYFQVSVHALIISAFVALALTGRLDAPSVLIFPVGVFYSLYRTLKNRPPWLSARAPFFLSCGYIAFFLFDSAILSRSFIPATIHLVLFLELAKLYQEKTDKDYFYLIVLAFLKILAASSLTIDMSFVVTLMLFLIALVSTLMSFDMYRAERQIHRESRDLGGPLGGMSVWATAWIVIIGIALFFIIPRIGTGYFSRAATQSLLLSGFTENVQLGEIGQVKLNTAVVMRAKLVSGTPYEVLKWRGIALDTFDGHTWRKTDRKHYRINPLNNQYSLRPLDHSGDPIRYQILLEPLATTALFVPYQPRTVSGKLNGLEVDNDDSIYEHTPSLNRVQYEVLSEIRTRSGWTDLLSNDRGSVPAEISATYLQLPVNFDPRIRDLALQITAAGKSSLEKATLVETYLRKNYKYTLNLNWQPGDRPISTFLFAAKEGHCEYFASAMALLLRSAGIPTRLVNGFQMGEYNPVGKDYIVRESDAHSWVEAYVPGRGWTEFDPTPPDPNHTEMGLAGQLSQYVDAAELYWNSYILIYDSTLQTQFFRNAQERVQSVQTDFRSRSDRWLFRSQEFSGHAAAKMRAYIETVWFWLGGLVLAAVLVLVRYRIPILTELRIRRLRRGVGKVDEQIVEQLFYRAARLGKSGGMERRSGQTWREWLAMVPDTERRAILSIALEIFEKTKYGRIPASSSDFALLDQAVHNLKG